MSSVSAIESSRMSLSLSVTLRDDSGERVVGGGSGQLQGAELGEQRAGGQRLARRAREPDTASVPQWTAHAHRHTRAQAIGGKGFIHPGNFCRRLGRLAPHQRMHLGVEMLEYRVNRNLRSR